MLDFAGGQRPAKLPGTSLRPLVEGRPVPAWTDEVISSNHMSQGGFVGDFVPVTEGRMVRTDRYKYCVYVHGEQRESLVDLINDPGEMVDLARDPGYRTVLLEHRERLRRFGRTHGDSLVETLLDQDVAPRAFERITTPPRGSGGGGGQ
jgi:choline-sulfatase